MTTAERYRAWAARYIALAADYQSKGLDDLADMARERVRYHTQRANQETDMEQAT